MVLRVRVTLVIAEVGMVLIVQYLEAQAAMVSTEMGPTTTDLDTQARAVTLKLEVHLAEMLRTAVQAGVRQPVAALKSGNLSGVEGREEIHQATAHQDAITVEEAP